MNRICLNMIVKDEIHVLERLFTSVKDIIDYYVIVDTGSTDGTQKFIKDWMESHGIPGQLYSHAWENFEVNRNQALNYAAKCGKADWLLLIDADEELVVEDLAAFTNLEPGVSYRMEKHNQSIRYGLPNLVSITNTSWSWHGVVHEYLSPEVPAEIKPFTGACIKVHPEMSSRSEGNARAKFLRDADLLEKALAKEPGNNRYWFYLAQSYRDAGFTQKAYETYLYRSSMLGWAEENFVAKLQAGRLSIELGMPYSLTLKLLLEAFETRPVRGAEPLHTLASYCRVKGLFSQAYLYAKHASEIPFPSKEMLFVEPDLYSWKILDELAVAAYWTGRYAESFQVCSKILNNHEIPEADRARISNNREYAAIKLRPG
jgi:hypothetical protein